MTKSCRNFKLYSSDMQTLIDMHAEGIWVEDVLIPSVSPRHETTEIDGYDGEYHLETTYAARQIVTRLQYENNLTNNIEEFKRWLTSFLNPKEFYYLVLDEDPTIRYGVRVSNSYSLEELTVEDGNFEIEFIMFSPFRETINLVEMEFTELSFVITNDGNEFVDPRKHLDTTYEFIGDSTGLDIHNLSTGEHFVYSGSTVSSVPLKMQGVRVLKGDVSVLKDTNKGILTLRPGENQIIITGASGPISFKIQTRFYFR